MSEISNYILTFARSMSLIFYDYVTWTLSWSGHKLGAYEALFNSS